MSSPMAQGRSRASTSTLRGLTIQYPWADLILSGRKTIETRFYPLPSKYVGMEIAIIETPGARGEFRSRLVGIVIFGPSFLYRDAQEFYADSARHLVRPDTLRFSWKHGQGKAKWGWPVLSA